MRITKKTSGLFLLVSIFSILASQAFSSQQFRKISVDEFRNKMKGGWLGQMAGVTWGFPTEFQYLGRTVPEDRVPQWKPEMINETFGQDDIYVEMTFLKTLVTYGFDVSIIQCGIDFANSKYALDHGNKYGRINLRKGIAPPDCSHPAFTEHCDDIDYQIEADFAGLIAPGLINLPIELGEKFGRLMCYGDGMYGGQLVGAMYAEAFFENDMQKVVEKALTAIPSGSQYHECVSDVLACYKKNPNDWKKAWNFINEKYHKLIYYRQYSCRITNDFNIDAKINGAYIAIGLLYGHGDIDETIKISMMCGQDSDCNPSSAAGILCTAIGYDKMPAKFKQISNETKFYTTDYNFPELIDVCEKLARKAVVRAGGKIHKSFGRESLIIPVQTPQLRPLEQSYAPASLAGSWFTDEQMAQITERNPDEAKKEPPAYAIRKFAPGWKVMNCGDYMLPGLYKKYEGRTDVLVTHPFSMTLPCSMLRFFEVPKGKKTTLHFVVGHHFMGDYELVVKIDQNVVLDKVVGPKTATNHFLEENVDLTAYAGKKISIEIQNKANGWACESAYWDELEIISK